jgi:hypothetical protein
MERSILGEYNVSQYFWAKTINTTCYCSNHLYYHPLKEKTPYELLNGRKPNIAYFQVFGCQLHILHVDGSYHPPKALEIMHENDHQHSLMCLN